MHTTSTMSFMRRTTAREEEDVYQLSHQILFVDLCCRERIYAVNSQDRIAFTAQDLNSDCTALGVECRGQIARGAEDR